MDNQCHCTGKCKLLGGLEQKIMDVLWSSDSPLKPSEVQKKISGNYAYTTVMTVLKRMSDKGLAVRKLIGNAYSYSPSECRHDFACNCLTDLFTRLFNTYGEEVVPAFKLAAKNLKIRL